MRFVSTIALFLIFLVVSIPICFSVQYSLTYDANGNLVSGDGKYRVYNSLNQLSQIYNGSNSSGVLLESYQYFPNEEKIQVKTIYNATGGIKETDYYISQSFIQIVNATGSYNFTYVYQNGQLVAQKNPDGSKYFFANDVKGDIVAVTNSSGVMIENDSYTPFGDIVSGATKSRYSYEGKEKDSVVGDTDFNARKYDPAWATFNQPDTVTQNVYDPQNLNRYMFERGNPYKHTDSSGHYTLQLGYSATWGAGIGGTGGQGSIIAYNPYTGEFQSGNYMVYGGGAFYGAASSATIDVSYSNNNNINDVGGWSVVTGGSTGYSNGVSAGGSFNQPVSITSNGNAHIDTSAQRPLPSATGSLGVGLGSPAEGHVFLTNTIITKNNKCDSLNTNNNNNQQQSTNQQQNNYVQQTPASQISLWYNTVVCVFKGLFGG